MIEWLMVCYFLFTWWFAILYINFEINPPPAIINAACKHPREVLGTSFSVVTLPICYNIEQEEGAWFLSAKWTIPQFSKNWLSLNNLRVILQFWVSLHEFDRKSFGSELASSITLILQANWRTPNVLVTPKFCDISKVLKTDLSQLKSTQDDLVFNFSTKITSKACYRRIAVETRFQPWSIYRFLLNCSLNCLLKCLHPVQLRK